MTYKEQSYQNFNGVKIVLMLLFHYRAAQNVPVCNQVSNIAQDH